MIKLATVALLFMTANAYGSASSDSSDSEVEAWTRKFYLASGAVVEKRESTIKVKANHVSVSTSGVFMLRKADTNWVKLNCDFCVDISTSLDSFRKRLKKSFGVIEREEQ